MANTIIFLHMFKSGGTTVTACLHDHFGDQYHAIFNTSVTHPRHPLQMMKNARFVSGHDLYGIHKCLPNSCRYITFLRDPVERIVSAYYNVREPRCSFHPLHKMFTECSLESCLDIKEGLVPWSQWDNYQVRELVGLSKADEYTMHEVDLERAKKNLDSFMFVGLTEQIDKQLPGLFRQLNIPYVPTPRLNVTKEKPATIDNNIRSKIRSLNLLDYQLLDWVKEHKCGS